MFGFDLGLPNETTATLESEISTTRGPLNLMPSACKTLRSLSVAWTETLETSRKFPDANARELGRRTVATSVQKLPAPPTTTLKSA
jgi:hypothetical protein